METWLKGEYEVLGVRFPNGTPIIRAKKGDIYELEEEWNFQILALNFVGKCAIDCMIHKGFEFDGASIPRVFWRIIGHPYSSDYVCAGLAHDWLYAAEVLGREINDDAFLYGLKECGVSWARRNAMYMAVNLFGWTAYMRHTKKSVKDARVNKPGVIRIRNK